MDHDPDSEPEEAGHDPDLAKQEDAVQSFGALRDHEKRSRMLRGGAGGAEFRSHGVQKAVSLHWNLG
jgi:hypothetical protein